MAETSSIEWTDATWNPITGCTLVSEGCRHCYAARLAATRMKSHPSRAGLARINAAGEAKFTGEVRFNDQWLDQPLRWSRPRRIFVCAHGDLFHEAVPDEWIDRVFAVMALAPQHTFQVLTKRPERARFHLQKLTDDGPADLLADTAGRYLGEDADVWLANFINGWSRPTFVQDDNPADGTVPRWPLPTVWLGTSVEDQATADARIPELLATPAAVRFVSAEPLLGPVDLRNLCDDGWSIVDALTPYTVAQAREDWGADFDDDCGMTVDLPALDWVIAGGESGARARPAHPDWFRSLRDQCTAAGVAFHFKQWGEWVSVSEVEGPGEHHQFPDGATVRRAGKKRAGRTLDGREWNETPAPTRTAEATT